MAVQSGGRTIAGGSMEQEMRVEAYRTRETPDYMVMARYLLPKIREAFANPDVEKAFQEWKRERDAGKAAQ